MDPATIVIVTIILGVAGVALGALGLAATIYYGRRALIRHEARVAPRSEPAADTWATSELK